MIIFGILISFNVLWKVYEVKTVCAFSCDFQDFAGDFINTTISQDIFSTFNLLQNYGLLKLYKDWKWEIKFWNYDNSNAISKRFWPHCVESKDNNDHGLRFETKKNGCNYRDGADNLFSWVRSQLDEISYVGVQVTKFKKYKSWHPKAL